MHYLYDKTKLNEKRNDVIDHTKTQHLGSVKSNNVSFAFNEEGKKQSRLNSTSST